MIRRMGVPLLVIAGLALVVFGGQRWLDNRAAAGVVKTFVAALVSGDREVALLQLSAEQRQNVEEKTGGADAAFWAPAPSMSYRVHHVELNGDTALVQMWMDKDGFVLEPVFHLRRTETSSWKIDRIENVKVDPRWHDIQKERARLADEAVKDELSEKLKKRPGVTVERSRSSLKEK